VATSKPAGTRRRVALHRTTSRISLGDRGGHLTKVSRDSAGASFVA
jgi:hypothetical protein